MEYGSRCVVGSSWQSYLTDFSGSRRVLQRTSMYITSFVLALLGLFSSTASSPARPVHSHLGSLATVHQLCACLSWWHLKHALSFSQCCLQQPGQHLLHSVDISRHHFTLAFGYVIRLRFQMPRVVQRRLFQPHSQAQRHRFPWPWLMLSAILFVCTSTPNI